MADPTMGGNPQRTLFFPTYSEDGGVTWKFLQPCLNIAEAKSRLRSQLPDGYHLVHDERFKNIKCGFLMGRTADMQSGEFFAELSPVDFVADSKL